VPKTASPLFADEPPDEPSGVRRLYTVAMMADVLNAPPAAVRHWVRGGLLASVRRSGAIEWFDFPQLVIGRRLVRLLAAGFSLRDIDDKLSSLTPGGAAEAARQSERIVTDGRRLSIRRGNRLMSAGGQLQLGFYTESLHADELDATPALLPRMESAPAPVEIDIEPGDEPTCVADLLDLADDLEAAGEYIEAAEALRAALQAGGPTAQIAFMLAELLYRAGDLTAARERYYAAVELDADHLEARASLGCVLAELGEHELALAALEGVLRQQPDYADAHWHMAGVLEEVGRRADAQRHLRAFLALAPESPWAALAREKLR
jgi:tetratricopeptide (TPR) repeat protein